MNKIGSLTRVILLKLWLHRWYNWGKICHFGLHHNFKWVGASTVNDFITHKAIKIYTIEECEVCGKSRTLIQVISDVLEIPPIPSVSDSDK